MLSADEYDIDEHYNTPIMQAIIQDLRIITDPSKTDYDRALAKYDLMKIRTLLADINDEMLMCKLMILGIRSQAKRLGDESPMNDYSTLDYSNPLHVKAIIRNCKITTPRPDDMASHIGYDLMIAVNKLRDRGSLSVKTFVTNVQDFIVHVRRGLGLEE